MNADSSLEHELRRLGAWVSSMPSIVDEVMARAMERPAPLRHRRRVSKRLAASIAGLAACLMVAITAGVLMRGGKPADTASTSETPRETPPADAPKVQSPPLAAAAPTGNLEIGTPIYGATHSTLAGPLSIRGLVIHSSTIVTAEPAGPAKFDGSDQEFKVVEVLKGSAIKSGQILTVRMEPYPVADTGLLDRNKVPEKPSSITQVLLFLTKPEGERFDAGQFRLVGSGLRCLDAQKRIWAPQSHWTGHGGWSLALEKDADWEKLIAATRADVPRVAEVMALKDIRDPAERNRAIFAWIEKHRGEFRPSFSGERKGNPGWEEVEWWTVEWILDTCRAEDAWRALKVSLEIIGNEYYVPMSRTPTFASPEGRKLLLGVLADAKSSAAQRRVALAALQDSLWPGRQVEQHPNLSSATPGEQAEIIEKITGFLKSDDWGTRELTAKVLDMASRPQDSTLPNRDTDAAFPALAEAYRREPPGYARNTMALIVRRLGGEGRWEKVSGNPKGILAVLSNVRLDTINKPETIQVDISMPRLAGGVKSIDQRPTLILERLGANGAVMERRTMPYSARYPEGLWTKIPWDGSQASGGLPSESLAEGTWRIRVEGAVGKNDTRTWHSEPWLLEVHRTKP
jgi:hypothetical protein